MVLVKIFLWGLLGLLLLLNIAATTVLLRAYFEVKARRYAQLILIWLIPLVGALLILYIHKEALFKRAKAKVGNHPNISEREAISHAVAYSQSR